MTNWIDSRIPQELITSELVLDNLLTNMPFSHIYWKNSEGVYLGCNEAQAKSLGLSSTQELIGKTDFDLPWERELAHRFWENDREVLTTGQAKSIEESTLINGEEAIALSLKTPMKDKNGKVIGILGISVDITNQKRTEKRLIEAKEALELANDAKQEFLENMKHDIRTPLTGIVGCADFIKEISSELRVKEYAQHLVNSSQALTGLLNEVLEYVKVESKHLPVLKKRFNLKHLVERMITLNQARAAQKNLNLLCSYDTEIPENLIGDSLRMSEFC
jgi:two-component system aerobic respiration control sensor histidine kinase ArcB